MPLSDREAGATNYPLNQILKIRFALVVCFISIFSLNNSDNLKGRANFLILKNSDNLKGRAKLFFQVLKFFKSSGILSCDSTGLREDSASFYFSIRSKKIRRRWIKLIYLVDTKTQACLSQAVARL
jgi:hypothetical protein